MPSLEQSGILIAQLGEVTGPAVHKAALRIAQKGRGLVIKQQRAAGHNDTGDMQRRWRVVDDGLGIRIVNDSPQARILDEGGTIKAKDKKLTVPIAPEAKRRRAADFPNAFLLVVPGGGAYLAIKSGRIHNGKQRPRLLFKLMSSVKIPASHYRLKALVDIENMAPDVIEEILAAEFQKAVGA